MNEPSRNEFTYDDLEPHAPSLGCLVVLPNPICSTGPHRAGNQFHRRRASPCSPPCPTDNTSYSPPPPYTSNNQPRSQTWRSTPRRPTCSSTAASPPPSAHLPPATPATDTAAGPPSHTPARPCDQLHYSSDPSPC